MAISSVCGGEGLHWSGSWVLPGTVVLGEEEGNEGGHLGTVAEGQRGDLRRVAGPVLLGARVQVFHHHQAAARVGKEACAERGRGLGAGPRRGRGLAGRGVSIIPGTGAPSPSPGRQSASQDLGWIARRRYQENRAPH